MAVQTTLELRCHGGWTGPPYQLPWPSDMASVAIRKWPQVTIYWGWAGSPRTFPEEPTKDPNYPGSSPDGWGLFCMRQR
ncbi:hypothetical protein GCM10009825_38280 [Arthrobacter humicola]|uniref:Uncharacterized protein n=1 Tax=Arthrobacter humicola TaxID=409291 RepID=A0ABN2ZPH3_9MICC